MSKLYNFSNFFSVVQNNLNWRKDSFYFITATIVTIVGDLLEPFGPYLDYIIFISLFIAIILAIYIFRQSSRKSSHSGPISLKTALDSFVALTILLMISTAVSIFKDPESERGLIADSLKIAEEVQNKIDPSLTRIEEGIEKLRHIEIATLPLNLKSNSWDISVGGFEENEEGISVYYLTKNGQQINITKHPAFLGFKHKTENYALLSFDWRKLATNGSLDIRLCYDKCSKTKDKSIKIDIEKESSDYAKRLILDSSVTGLRQGRPRIKWNSLAFMVCPQAFKKIEITVNGQGRPIEYPLNPPTINEIIDSKPYKPFPLGGIELPANTQFIVVDIELIDGSSLNGLRFSL